MLFIVPYLLDCGILNCPRAFFFVVLLCSPWFYDIVVLFLRRYFNVHHVFMTIELALRKSRTKIFNSRQGLIFYSLFVFCPNFLSSFIEHANFLFMACSQARVKVSDWQICEIEI